MVTLRLPSIPPRARPVVPQLGSLAAGCASRLMLEGRNDSGVNRLRHGPWSRTERACRLVHRERPTDVIASYSRDTKPCISDR
jgi:hypothetical protein